MKLFGRSKDNSEDIQKKIHVMGQKKDVKGLIKTLTYKSNPPNSGDEIIRLSAVIFLGEIGDKRAIEELKQALNNEYRLVRNSAAEQLINLDVPNVVELLSSTFSEHDLKIFTDYYKARREQNKHE